jgi:hypothetical protein
MYYYFLKDALFLHHYIVININEFIYYQAKLHIFSRKIQYIKIKVLYRVQ